LILTLSEIKLTNIKSSIASIKKLIFSR